MCMQFLDWIYVLNAMYLSWNGQNQFFLFPKSETFAETFADSPALAWNMIEQS